MRHFLYFIGIIIAIAAVINAWAFVTQTPLLLIASFIVFFVATLFDPPPKT